MESFWQLRSESSPERLELKFSMPPGAELRMDPDSRIAAEVVEDGRTLLTIVPPTAWDADGVTVPVSMSTDGSVLALSVAHRSETLRYPILVDPVMVSRQYGSFHPSNAAFSVFSQERNPAGGTNFMFESGPPLKVRTSTGSSGNVWAYHRVNAPGTSQLWRVDLREVYFSTALGKPVYFYGLLSPSRNGGTGVWTLNGYDPNSGSPTPLYSQAGFGPKSIAFCALRAPNEPNGSKPHDGTRPAGFCESMGGVSGNNFQVGLFTNGSYFGPELFSQVGGASLTLGDAAPPTNVIATGLPTGWVPQLTSVTVSATQPGLGVGRLIVNDGANTVGTFDLNCYDDSATRLPPCPTSTGAKQVTVPNDAVGQGVRSISVQARSITEVNSAPTTYQAKIDRTKPTISKPSDTTVYVASPIAVSATDDHSGVGGLSAEVTTPSGAIRPLVVDKPCQNVSDGCGVSAEFTLPLQEFGYGRYVVRYHAYDRTSPRNEDSWAYNVDYAPAPQVPGAPTGVTAVAGDSRADVSWTAPTSDGGAAVSHYTVTLRPGDGSAAVTREVASGTAMPVTVSGLANGNLYRVTVKARNAVGYGAESAPPVDVTPRTVPGAPTNVLALAGDKSATVRWTAPLQDGGAAVDGYQITAWRVDGVEHGTADASASARELNFTGLVNGQDYYFTVRARNAAGYGPRSQNSNTVRPVGLGNGSDRSRLGLEHYFGYESWATGDGSALLANVDTGNMVWQHELFSDPGIGLDTTATLTYNSQDQPSLISAATEVLPGLPVSGQIVERLAGQPYRQLGVGFSLSLGTLTRLNEPLAGVADAVMGPVDRPEKVVLTDADGTAHVFTRTSAASVEPPTYAAPPGVFLKFERASGGRGAGSMVDDATGWGAVPV